MPTVRWTDDPRVTDTVLIDFTTTDVDGSPLNPYRVDTVTIYFLERSYATGSLRLVETGDETNPTVSYSMAVPVKTYGSDEMAAWDSLDPGSSEFVRIDTDDEGNPVFGTFRILCRKGTAADNDKLGGGDWCPTIELDTGKIEGWPEGTVASLHYKVCDDGDYELLDADRNIVKAIDGYVPGIMCPGGKGYGDYVIMDISPDGAIKNWRVDLSDFERGEDR
jgi:hypothetical protein